jgi:hypothetical protein
MPRSSRGMTVEGCEATFPRHEMPECCIIRVPPKRRGRRECRVTASPMARLQTKNAGGSDHRFSRINRHSLRDGFTTYVRALLGVPGFLATVTCLSSAGLIPASGDQDHTISPSAPAPLVSRCLCVHRIPRPTSVTIAKRPSWWTRDARKGATDLPDGASEIFGGGLCQCATRPSPLSHRRCRKRFGCAWRRSTRGSLSIPCSPT